MKNWHLRQRRFRVLLCICMRPNIRLPAYRYSVRLVCPVLGIAVLGFAILRYETPVVTVR